MTPTAGLFGDDLPAGLRYEADFISDPDERDLLEAIAHVAFDDFTMRGVVARRRVAFFGQSYDRAAARPMPDFLLPLRSRLSAWARVSEDAFAMALINEYRPGSPIGWHRDAPQYGITAGVSLLSECRMKFRPYRPPGSSRPAEKRTATHEIALARRSAYLMTGKSRNDFEHHIPPVERLRYSITFRTVRD